jgi:hypothetical protein
MTRITIAILAVAASTVAVAEPLPHPKTGQCSGGYCIPKSDRSPPAIPKVGSCPSGWRQSGSTCDRMQSGLR